MAVYRQRSTVAGFDYSMMVTYLLVSQAVNNVYGFRNDAERPISEKIRKGTIVFDLLRPVKFVNARLAENVGQTILQVFFAILALLGFRVFLPELSGPPSLLWADVCRQCQRRIFHHVFRIGHERPAGVLADEQLGTAQRKDSHREFFQRRSGAHCGASRMAAENCEYASV